MSRAAVRLFAAVALLVAMISPVRAGAAGPAAQLVDVGDRPTKEQSEASRPQRGQAAVPEGARRSGDGHARDLVSCRHAHPAAADE
jgi:hypothetical protein